MGNHSLSLVEPDCRRERLVELDHLRSKLQSLLSIKRLELSNSLGQTMGQGNLFTPEPTQEPEVMISDDAPCNPTTVKADHAPECVEVSITTIDKITDQNDNWFLQYVRALKVVTMAKQSYQVIQLI